MFNDTNQCPCPCGSGASYTDCCKPIISRVLPAITAEQLMRARYCAYVFVEMDFIFDSMHPEHRQNYDPQGTKKWAESAKWQGLEIVGTQKGGADDAFGEVEFIARFIEDGVSRTHHEKSQFKRKDGNWYFSEGRMVPAKGMGATKIGRNDPCHCDSGLKYKKCCGK